MEFKQITLVLLGIILIFLSFSMVLYMFGFGNLFGAAKIGQDVDSAGIWWIIAILLVAGIYFLEIAMKVIKSAFKE